jgi:hypothetical protein
MDIKILKNDVVENNNEILENNNQMLYEILNSKK